MAAADGWQEGQPVTLTGWYRDETWLLDNRTRAGRAGYEVLTLFEPVSGPFVVINRGGWVPAPASREQLPEVKTPEPLFTLQGRLAAYPEPPVLGGAQEPDTPGWPRRVQALPESRVRVLGSTPAPPMIVHLADSQQPGAYRADRAPDVMGPQTHYGYAAQWFALAVALTILTLVASYKKKTAKDPRQEPTMTTTTADSLSHSDGPSPAQVRRGGRRTAMLLFAVGGFGPPMLVATVMFYTGWLNPAGQSNQGGQLVQPPVPVAELNLQTAAGGNPPLQARFGVDVADPKWLMLVASERCTEDCEQLLYLLARLTLRLARTRRVLVVPPIWARYRRIWSGAGLMSTS